MWSLNAMVETYICLHHSQLRFKLGEVRDKGPFQQDRSIWVRLGINALSNKTDKIESIWVRFGIKALPTRLKTDKIESIWVRFGIKALPTRPIKLTRKGG